MLGSILCRYEDFLTDWYAKWALQLKFPAEGPAAPPDHIPHRKRWEWCAVAQALKERGMLEPGKTGCGFAVGTEPLPSIFAASGVRILATDQASGENAEDWIKTGQHAASLESLYREDMISRSDFDARVRFRAVDMRNLKLPWREQFDFIWSSCSIEHLGSLEAGWQFVTQAMDLVKDGGLAVHTTEFNVASNDSTIEEGNSVIYRRRDVEELDRRLRAMSCGLSRCDFFAGDHEYDLNYDYPPYGENGRPHVKLLLGGYVATSMVLIIRKGRTPSIGTNRVFSRDELRVERDAAVDEQSQLREERDVAVAEIAALRASTSWRMTAPIRSAIRTIRRR